MSLPNDPFVFGIYPGGGAGSDNDDIRLVGGGPCGRRRSDGGNVLGHVSVPDVAL